LQECAHSKQMIYLKLVLTMAFWGGTFIAGRVVVQTLGPFSAAFCRFAIASLCLLALTRTVDGNLPKLKRHQLPLIVLLGLSGIFAYNVLFFLGLQTTPASRAALIIALNPCVVALSGALLFRERLKPLKWAGIFISLIGAAVVISRGDPITLITNGIGLGDLFLVGCVLSWVVYTLVGKRVMGELSPFAATTYACLVGTAALAIPAWVEASTHQWPNVALGAWIGVAYLGLLGTAAGFTWYYEGVKAIGSAKAAIFINLVPVFAIAFAVAFLGEHLTIPLLIGGLFVMAGVYLTNRSA
jgi:drug/metabolite transporter (DMT)-like permease